MALLGDRGPKTISWETGEKDQLVFKYPDTELRMGDAVVVRENQMAVFFRDGKALDTFKPGRVMITSGNVPILTGILQKIGWDNKSPFQVELIYVNMGQFKGRFGGKGYSAPSGDVKYQAEVKFHGYYLFKIEDPMHFVLEFFANRGLTASTDVEDYIRGFVNERVIDSMGNHNIINLVKTVDVMTDKIAVKVTGDASRLGLKLIDLVFEELNIPEEARRFASGMGGTAMMMDYMKQTASEVGGGEGGSGGGSAAAAGLGGGMGLMMPFMMMNQMNKMGTPGMDGGQVSAKMCPSCNQNIPTNAKFCPFCGSDTASAVEQKIEVPMTKCAKCSAEIPRDVNFCPDCGEKVEVGAQTSCAKCGKGVAPGVKFCPHCGTRME